MAEYNVTGPDGTKYKVTGPDGATDEQVLSQVHAYTNPQPSGQLGKLATKAQGEERKAYPDNEVADFVAGNINKGLAGAFGLPVDTAQNLYNLGKAGIGVATGRPQDFPLVSGTPGGSESIEGVMRNAGMIRPGAEPTSPVGEYGARALQFGAGAMVPMSRFNPAGRIPVPPASMAGRIAQPAKDVAATVLPRFKMGATAGLASQAAEDIGGPEYGPVGAMAPGARLRSPPGAGARGAEERVAQRYNTARERGIPVPPRDMKPDRPQQTVQDLIAKQLNIPAGTEIEPKMLNANRASHYDDYLAIIKEPALQGKIISTPKFQQTIQDIARGERGLRREFPNIVKDKDMQAALSDFTKPEYSAERAMRIVQRLRDQAGRNLGVTASDQQAQLGRVQKQMANAMESLIEENLQRIGNPELMQRFRQARTAIAMSHDVQSSIGKDGKIDPTHFSKLLSEGKPLSGELKAIGELSGQFPGAMRQKPEGDMFSQRMSPSAVRHPTAAAAHGAARLTDPITMSAPYQRLFVDPATKVTPDQERLIRLLLSGQAAQQAQIPRPPE